MWWGPAGRAGAVACALLLGALVTARTSSACAQTETPDGPAGREAEALHPSGGGRADPAEAAFRSGVEAFDAGEYDAALARFRASYRLRAAPQVLYNIAVAERLSGRTALACRDLRRYLRDVVDLPSERRVVIARELDALRRQVGELRLRVSPGGASVVVDGREVGASPLTESIFLDPGEHDVAVSRDGFVTERRTLRLRAAAEETVELRLRRDRAATRRDHLESPTALGPTSHEPSALASPWLWTVVGVVVAGAATVTVVALSSSSEPDGARLTFTSPFALSSSPRASP